LRNDPSDADVKKEAAMADKPMILKGVIHGRTIVLNCDPGLEDGCEVAVQLAASPHASREGASDSDASDPCSRWPEDCEGIQCIQSQENPHPTVDGWAEVTD
jgi:hypothetical protein